MALLIFIGIFVYRASNKLIGTLSSYLRRSF